jgi:hypothetical protein
MDPSKMSIVIPFAKMREVDERLAAAENYARSLGAGLALAMLALKNVSDAGEGTGSGVAASALGQLAEWGFHLQKGQVPAAEPDPAEPDPRPAGFTPRLV